MSIELPNMPEALKGRYSDFSCESSEHYFRVDEINELNKSPIKVGEASTEAFKVFAHEFNSIMLTAHLFENLLILEDVRHELAGYDWFQIDIPEEYFRYPALNDPRNYVGTTTPELSREERQEISDVVSKAKEMTNYANDENFAKNNLHKLEFIFIFSFLESFVENLRVEILGYSRADASKYVRYTSLPEIMKNTFNEINPDINILLNKLSNNFYGFFTYCYLLRNLHSHNLGKVTPRFMKLCEDAKILEDDYLIKVSDGSKIIKGKQVNFTSYRYPIKEGRYITLSSVNYSFRNYARECVNIVEQYIQQKSIQT